MVPYLNLSPGFFIYSEPASELVREALGFAGPSQASREMTSGGYTHKTRG